MGDPKPVATTVAKPASTANDIPPATPEAKKASEPPRVEGFGVQPRFELNAGASYPIGDSFLAHGEAGYLFLPWLYVGGAYNGNFTSKNSGALALGFRWNINDVLSIQPTVIGGIGKMSDYSGAVGPLKENVTLNGTYYYLNPEIRFMVEPPNVAGIGFFVAPGFMAEFRGGTDAIPTNLISGEDPQPNSYAPTISFGITWGHKPKKAQPKKEDYVPPPPPVTEEPKAPPPPPEKLSDAQLQKRIEDTEKKLIEGRKKDEAERIQKAIAEVRANVRSLQTKVSQINDGINLTNKIGRNFEETLDKLNASKAKPLSEDDKKAFSPELERLLTALELNASHQPVSKSEESEAIRKGLRFVYLNKRYGERFQKQMERLKKELTAHKEKDLASKVDSAMTRLTTYLDQYPDSIRVEDLTQDVNTVQGSMQGLESVEKDYKLADNPDWTQLKTDLEATRTRVSQMNRELNAMRDLGAIFQGNGNYFGDQVDTPDRAKKTYEAALKFIKEMPGTEKYSGVTIEILRERYADYFGHLSYNVDHFISDHIPPEEKKTAERKKWFETVTMARDLLCQVNPKHARCGVELEEPPKGAVKKTPPKDPKDPPPPPPPPKDPKDKPPPPPKNPKDKPPPLPPPPPPAPDIK